MSKKNSFSPSRAAKAALGSQGFVPHTPELLSSDAWRGRSIHLVRLLDYFEIEHLAHAGKENGFLHATYQQLVAHGIGRRFIRPAIGEGVSRGLVRITHKGGYRGSGRADPARYQLTYLPWKFVPASGAPQYLDPTNEWKAFGAAGRPRKSRLSAAAKANGHDAPPRHKEQSEVTKRESARERYIKINAPNLGMKSAIERWATYEKLILEKYGNGSDDLDAAWASRNRLH